MLRFGVDLPVWRRAWFLALIAISLCAIGLQTGRVIHRGRRLRQANQELENRVQARTAELEAANRALTVENAERKRMEERLRQAERDRVLVETAGAAAHEINQPLAVISGLAQILMGTTPEDDPHREDFREIHKGTVRIQDILLRMKKAQKYDTKPYVGNAKIVDFDRASQDK